MTKIVKRRLRGCGILSGVGLLGGWTADTALLWGLCVGGEGGGVQSRTHNSLPVTGKQRMSINLIT